MPPKRSQTKFETFLKSPANRHRTRTADDGATESTEVRHVVLSF